MDLTDEQLAILEPRLPEEERTPPQKRGRPWKAPRDVLHGVRWVLRTGAPWHDLPERYPPYQTCHRRFQRWVRTGVLATIVRAVARDRPERGGLDITECFIDAYPCLTGRQVLQAGHCRGGTTGGDGVGTTKRGKGTTLMAVADRAGLPIAVSVTRARPHEVTLVEPTLAACVTPKVPEKLIADRAYDSDPLDARLAEQGIELIAPQRRNRRKART